MDSGNSCRSVRDSDSCSDSYRVSGSGTASGIGCCARLTAHGARRMAIGARLSEHGTRRLATGDRRQATGDRNKQRLGT